ncbi:MAG TPA: hydrogenase formation protein HypD [Ignavibacteriaceae bacterium]|nr:hydrogenase formation protein HypD [Ignavibacteriaceae bacterium]
MKYIDEYRERTAVESLSKEIFSAAKKPWSIMEICGGQTHSILKYDLEDLLPKEISLIHGPGCPVCVTPIELIDKAINIASKEDTIFTSFGDMLRVPGSKEDLLSIKAKGASVRIVYSPLDALKTAEQNRDHNVVFFAVGFETTAPANAMSIIEAKRRGLKNFSVLCSNVLIPPAIEALLESGKSRIQALLAAGHVCTVMGYEEYIPIAEKFKIPIVVTGFEPADILQGIFCAVKQLEEGRYNVENQYKRAVRREGNPAAINLLNKVFERSDRKWRGIGLIPKSGYKIRDEYSEFDAEEVFQTEDSTAEESQICIAGLVLQGIKKPVDCTAFGKHCIPEHPLGAPMVSSEGACSAYFRYKRSFG